MAYCTKCLNNLDLHPVYEETELSKDKSIINSEGTYLSKCFHLIHGSCLKKMVDDGNTHCYCKVVNTKEDFIRIFQDWSMNMKDLYVEEEVKAEIKKVEAKNNILSKDISSTKAESAKILKQLGKAKISYEKKKNELSWIMLEQTIKRNRENEFRNAEIKRRTEHLTQVLKEYYTLYETVKKKFGNEWTYFVPNEGGKVRGIPKAKESIKSLLSKYSHIGNQLRNEILAHSETRKQFEAFILKNIKPLETLDIIHSAEEKNDALPSGSGLRRPYEILKELNNAINLPKEKGGLESPQVNLGSFNSCFSNENQEFLKKINGKLEGAQEQC